ncbi:tubulin-specific chaperone C isoform X1 [Rhipicephalus sanguineus]|uniref:tubulin-specific chaperone C isoform X1 n=1 Tax=Rhipicephalus sanguineus TaxID=34632 RepID=UPI001895550F|nr:tubulin-specific chaperone C isoform X1 [Rhipicephalus sanguineus]
MGSLEVEGDSGRPQHEQHVDLLDKFGQCKRQLEQLLDTNDLAQLDGKLQELQAILTEVASHLPAASLRYVQEQFATLKLQVDEIREQLKPRKRFAFKSARGSPTGRWDTIPQRLAARVALIPTFGEPDRIPAGPRSEDAHDTARRQPRVRPESATLVGDARLEGKCEAGPSFPAGTLKNACTVGFQGRSGETLMLSEVGGKDTELDSLDDCQVTIQGCPATLFARRLRNCHIRCGPVASSVFVEECESCTFLVACHQLRVHDSHKCEFRVHVQTRSIIEDSKELLFGKYDFAYDGDEQDWCASHLDRTVNNWNKVGS